MPNDRAGFDQGEYDRPTPRAHRAPEYIVVPAGTRTSQCRGKSCHAVIYWVERPSKKDPTRLARIPVDCDFDAQCTIPTMRDDGLGINHFGSCPDANKF